MRLGEFNTAALVVAHHHLAGAVEQDEDGFWVVTCICGEKSMPAPDVDIAVDGHMGHVLYELGQHLCEPA